MNAPIDVEERLRRSLHQRASDVRLSPDAWQRIAERTEHRGRRWMGTWLAVGGAAVGAATLAIVTVAGPSPLEQAVETTIPPAAESPDPSAAVAPPAATGVVPAVWPASTPEGLREAADRFDLGHPDTAARAYLADRYSVPADSFAGEHLAGSPTAGRLMWAFDGDTAAHPGLQGATGEVFVGRTGPGEPWYVAASSVPELTLHGGSFDGSTLDLTVTAEAAGTLDYQVSPLEGGDPVAAESIEVTAGQDVRLPEALSARAGVVVRLGLATPGGGVRIAEIVLPTEEGSPGDTATGEAFTGIFPTTDAATMAELDAEASAGSFDDARALAQRYLDEQVRVVVGEREETVGGGPLTFTTGELQEGDSSSGEVPYTSSAGDQGVVLVRRFDGPGRSWYVTGLVSERVAATLTYADGRLRGSITATTDGIVTGAAAPPDGGEEAPDWLQARVTAGEPIEVDEPMPATGRLLVTVRLETDDTGVVAVTQVMLVTP